ncbi:MAG: chloride channel protein [Clostridia bacterium]|nr:chloride channel protein [Clostridia bacterium]
MNKKIKFTFASFIHSARILVKWLFCSVIMGLLVGIVGALFYWAIYAVTNYRQEHPYVLFLLPVGGLMIIALYHLLHSLKNSGTNLVLKAIQSNEEVPIKVSLLIIVSTLITHLCGGSAGREGAALQIGGSFGNHIAKKLNFDSRDTKILIMCGMSACFSALFGTPMAAAIFSMEVVSVGLMHYAALVPCVLASLIAYGVAGFFDIPPTAFSIGTVPGLGLVTGLKSIILAACLAAASILFCISLHKNEELFGKYFKNPYIKIFVSGLLLVAINFLLGTTDYMGAGSNVIARSFTQSEAWYVFLLKLLLTSITLSGGFKGGEIVPSLFIGATLGSFLSSILGLPTALCAACGMIGVFCGVTNCPITSLLMAIEMFGTDAIHYCIMVIAISYLLSGYYSLYSSQKIVYSKYEPRYINRNAKH